MTTPPIETEASPVPPLEGIAPSPMRGIGKHTLIYGAGILLNKGIAFLMLPLYTRVLTPADYGVLGLISMTIDVIAIAAGHQLVQGVYRFYHKAGTETERGEVVSTALVAMGISFLITGGVAFVASEQLSVLIFGDARHTLPFRIAAGAFALESSVLVPLAYARVRDRSTFFVTAGAAKLLLQVGMNLLFLLVLKLGVVGILLGTLVANACVGGALSVWVLRSTGISFSRRAFRDLARFGVPLIAMQFATFTSTFGDRYFLQAAGREAAVGIYDLAYKFGFLMVLVGFSPFMQVWEPKRFEIWQDPDRDRLLARGFQYLNLLLLTTALGVALFVEPVLRIIADPAFHGAAVLVPLLLLAYILQSWAQVLNIGILVRDRTELLTIAEWAAAGFALLAYALLIPRFLAWGAAIATLLTFAIRFALIYAFGQRLEPVRYVWRPVLRLLLLVIALSGIHLLLPEMPVVQALAASTLLFAGYAALLWWGPVLPGEHRELLHTVARDWAGRLRAPARGEEKSACSVRST